MKKEELEEIRKENRKKGKEFLTEFKEFALKGNVIDLAIGVLIGTSFQTIVTSFTQNIISPILGCFGEVNFSEFEICVGKLRLTYGAFITDVINFIIMAFVIFIIVKIMNKLAKIGSKKEEVKEESTTKICPYCYSEINIKAKRCPNCTSELDEEKLSVE